MSAYRNGRLCVAQAFSIAAIDIAPHSELSNMPMSQSLLGGLIMGDALDVMQVAMGGAAVLVAEMAKSG
ncbi:hypothetical protein [Streptomyces sp. CB02923]|uniref:hypothetical protein n=1 Tax=Streptomyces sp. CB02923 TaxID=1718985 RepID=UPI001901DA19|nr:hypothetical protein [Streptomyces sp. CB02923]